MPRRQQSPAMQPSRSLVAIILAIALVAALVAADCAAAGTWKTDSAIKAHAEDDGGTGYWELVFPMFRLACDGSAPAPVTVVVVRISSTGDAIPGTEARFVPHRTCGFWAVEAGSTFSIRGGLMARPVQQEEAEALQKSSAEASKAERLMREAGEVRSYDPALAETYEEQAKSAQAAEPVTPGDPLNLTFQMSDTVTHAYYFYAVAIKGMVVQEGTFTGLGTPRVRRHYWAGSDEFVNYCIDENQRIESENGRLYCLGPEEGGTSSMEAGWPVRVRTAFLAHRHRGGGKKRSKRRSKHRGPSA